MGYIIHYDSLKVLCLVRSYHRYQSLDIEILVANGPNAIKRSVYKQVLNQN